MASTLLIEYYGSICGWLVISEVGAG